MAETGHFPTRAYFDQQGVLHLNGTNIQWDDSNNNAVVLGSVGTLAAAGSAQGSAAAITNATTTVTGADGTKGVILPTPVLGQEITVINTNGVSALKVYPDSGGTGGTINGGSANAAVSLAATKGATYVCTGVSPTAWWSVSN